MKKVISLFLVASFLLLLASCGEKKQELQPLRIGVVKGSAQVERDVFDNMTSRLEAKGFQLTYLEYDTDEETLEALENKAVDFTCCTTLGNFTEYDKAHPETLLNLGSAYYYPYGIFLCGFEKAEQITDGASIALPQEAEGLARALMLLDDAGYIKLKDGKTLDATLDDIAENERGFALSCFPESELANRYKEWKSDLVVMNSQTAVAAGYSVHKYSIAIEAIDSVAAVKNAAVLLINREEISSERIQTVKSLFFSPLMYDLIDEAPNDIIAPAFEISSAKLNNEE
ncbi:MAG TPA: hypothetical protein DDY98_01585 [Ruminococcaceae bacterium]|nr:hypothetical protein [Oscillospiraceae bacterium]